MKTTFHDTLLNGILIGAGIAGLFFAVLDGPSPAPIAGATASAPVVRAIA